MEQLKLTEPPRAYQSDAAAEGCPEVSGGEITKDAEIQFEEPGLAQSGVNPAAGTSQSERSRRYRARKRAGRLVAVVEIDETVLALLSQGAKVGANKIRQDRTKLNAAVSRALRHYALRFQRTGRING